MPCDDEDLNKETELVTKCFGANLQTGENQTKIDVAVNCVPKKFEHLCHQKHVISKELIEFGWFSGLTDVNATGLNINTTRINICCCDSCECNTKDFAQRCNSAVGSYVNAFLLPLATLAGWMMW